MTTVRSIAALLLLASVLAAPTVLAQEPEYSLAWVRAQGAELCPNADRLAAQVSARLGRDPFAASAERSLEVVVRSEDGLWLSQIHVRDAQGVELGSRRLESAERDCGSIFEATVLAIALTIDPQVLVRSDDAVPTAPARDAELPRVAAPPAPAEPRPPRSFAPLAQPAAPPAAPVARRCPEPRPAAPCLPEPGPVAITTARGVTALGLLPKPVVGAAIAAVGRHPSGWAWSLGMALLPSVHTEGENGDFGVGLTYGALAVGYGLGRRDLASVLLGAGMAAGALHTVVYSPLPADTGDLVWLAAQVVATTHLRLVGPLAGELGVTGLVPLLRYQLRVEGRDPAFFAPPLGVVPHLGLGLILP